MLKGYSNRDIMNGTGASKHNIDKLKDLYKKKDPNDQGITKTDLFTLFKGNLLHIRNLASNF